MQGYNKKDESVEELVRHIFEDTGSDIEISSQLGMPSNIYSVSSLPANHPLRQKNN